MSYLKTLWGGVILQPTTRGHFKFWWTSMMLISIKKVKDCPNTGKDWKKNIWLPNDMVVCYRNQTLPNIHPVRSILRSLKQATSTFDFHMPLLLYCPHIAGSVYLHAFMYVPLYWQNALERLMNCSVGIHFSFQRQYWTANVKPTLFYPYIYVFARSFFLP